jgi:intracellular sulfur oxidation DsrE/DsrF family protein
MRRAVLLVLVLLAVAISLFAAPQQESSGWQNPVIKSAGGAIPLPNAAVQPEKNKQYKVLFDITKGSDDPKEVLPGLDHAARVMNAMAMSGVPLKNIHMVLVFHGRNTTIGSMNNETYQAKYHVDNPNAEVLKELKQAGAEIYVCGQAMHALHFTDKDLLPEVKVALAAVIVLVVYQNNGYALMPF